MIKTCRRLLRRVLPHWANESASVVAEFRRNGSIPWTPGYNQHKWQAIGEAIQAGDFDSLVGTHGFGYRIDERIVELPWLLSRLPDGPGTLLDAGSALNHLPVLAHPKLAAKRVFISTLAPERKAYWERGISYVYEDLRQTCFREGLFDVIACISTLEHVGMDNTLLYSDDPAAKEADPEAYLPLVDVLRLRLRDGGRLFLSVPFGRRKSHGWFQVFDGTMLDAVTARFSPAGTSESIFMYLDDRWQRVGRAAAREAACYDPNTERERPPDCCAFSRAVACLELTR